MQPRVAEMPYGDFDDIIQQRKRNPLVAVGALATSAVLIAGLFAFRNGNSQLSQRMMRLRVIAQGATVAVMAGSTYAFVPRSSVQVFRWGAIRQEAG